MPGKRPAGTEGGVSSPVGRGNRRPAMFSPHTDDDPLTPTGCQLLTQIGVDPGAVRETLADDFDRRCADREVPEDQSEREAKE